MSLALQVRTTLARTAVTSCAAACLVLCGCSSVYYPAESWQAVVLSPNMPRSGGIAALLGSVEDAE